MRGATIAWKRRQFPGKAQGSAEGRVHVCEAIAGGQRRLIALHHTSDKDPRAADHEELHHRGSFVSRMWLV